VTHPAYNEVSKANDIGVVRLASPAPAGTTPYPVLPAALVLAVADEGDPIRFVGYGRTETEPTGVKREVGGTLGLVCARAGCSFAGVAVPIGSFAYDQTLGGPCLGDSGGPALMTRGDTEFVIGVTAAGDAACVSYGVSTTADRHQQLVEDFAAVGLAGECLATDCPSGSPCETSVPCGLLSCLDQASFSAFADGYCSAPCDLGVDECPSDSVCAELPMLSAPHCMRRCASVADCRAGYDCTLVNGTRACVPPTPPAPEGAPTDGGPGDGGATDAGPSGSDPGSSGGPPGSVLRGAGCACRAGAAAPGAAWWLLAGLLRRRSAARRRQRLTPGAAPG
jgi:hypothetical protein